MFFCLSDSCLLRVAVACANKKQNARLSCTSSILWIQLLSLLLNWQTFSEHDFCSSPNNNLYSAVTHESAMGIAVALNDSLWTTGLSAFIEKGTCVRNCLFFHHFWEESLPVIPVFQQWHLRYSNLLHLLTSFVLLKPSKWCSATRLWKKILLVPTRHVSREKSWEIQISTWDAFRCGVWKKCFGKCPLLFLVKEGKSTV